MKLNFTNLLGSVLLIWYGCWRWNWYADAIKYAWAYKPINLATAFTSLVWIAFSLFYENKTMRKTMWWYAAIYKLLILRNIFYTIEDIIDFILSATTCEYAFFILMDVLMIVYIEIWLNKFKKIEI